MLIERIRNLGPRGELVLVSLVSFTYFIVTSSVALILHLHPMIDTRRALTGMAVELVMLAAFAFILGIRGWTPARLGLRFSWKALLAGVPLCLAYLCAWIGIMSFVMIVAPVEYERFEVTAPVPLLVALLLLNSLYEEVTVTAFLVESLTRDGAAVAIAASTLIRLSYHLYQGPVALVSIIPMGLIFGAVYWRFRTLWPLMTAHTLLNLISFARET